MRIALVTLSTPTFNNVRAASALPYHLILGAKQALRDAEFGIFSYNINEIDSTGLRQTEEALGATVRLLDRPWWQQWMFRLHLLFLRFFLGRPLVSYYRLPDAVVADIKAWQPDKVWIYGEEIAHLARHFEGLPCVVTMPDCESLYYYRLLGLPWISCRLAKTMRYGLAYWQYKRMERRDSLPGVTYHFVGKADAEFYQRTNPDSHVVFLPHPLYAHRPKDVAFHHPKIKLLFAGRYDFYCRHGSDSALQSIVEQASLLSNDFEITFLGKGWEQWNARLAQAGFTTHHILFAPDYIEELQRHDIQINVIDVGTGTKGKVLDAIANGLLTIGSPLALENIAVVDGESCVIIKRYAEIAAILKLIKSESERYVSIAQRGRSKVLDNHDGVKIAQQLFSL